MLAGPVVIAGGNLPWHRHCRSGAGFHLGDYAGGHRGPDDVVAAVVLTDDLVEGLDVDGMVRAPRLVLFPSPDRCRAVDWSPLSCNGYLLIGCRGRRRDPEGGRAA